MPAPPGHQVDPILTPDRKWTFGLWTPLQTHWRIVDCATAAEYGECDAYIDGYVLDIPPEFDHEGNVHAFREARLVFKEIPSQQPGFHAYWFPPGQPCANSIRAPHRIPNGREPILTRVTGDSRWIDRHTLIRMSEKSWTDCFGSNQDALADKVQRG